MHAGLARGISPHCASRAIKHGLCWSSPTQSSWEKHTQATLKDRTGGRNQSATGKGCNKPSEHRGAEIIQLLIVKRTYRGNSTRRSPQALTSSAAFFKMQSNSKNGFLDNLQQVAVQSEHHQPALDLPVFCKYYPSISIKASILTTVRK